MPSEHYYKDYFDVPDTQAIDYLSMKTNLAGSEMAPLTEAFQYEPHTSTPQCTVGLPQQESQDPARWASPTHTDMTVMSTDVTSQYS